MIRTLQDRKKRHLLLQALYVSCITLTIIYFCVMAQKNMAIQGISIGWAFLDYSTGWNIPYSVIAYKTSDTYARALWVGMVNTLILGFISILLALIIGVFIGTCRLSANKLLRQISSAYVQLFRNIPLILQGFFWYALISHLPPPRGAHTWLGSVYISNRGVFYPELNIHAGAIITAIILTAAGLWLFIALKKTRHHGTGRLLMAVTALAAFAALAWGRTAQTPLLDSPTLQGLRFVGGGMIVPEFFAAIVAISLFGGAYVAEIVRSGFQSVPKGLTEAGAALALSKGQVFWKVQAPLMIRIVLPSMTSQIIWLMKATSVGIAVGFSDFFAVVSSSINNSGQTISLLLILAGGFWCINMSISIAMNRVGRAMALPGAKK